MKSMIIILLGLSACWHFTDLSADSTLQSLVAPLGLMFFIMAAMIWLVLKAGFGRSISHSELSSTDLGDFGGDGGAE